MKHLIMQFSLTSITSLRLRPRILLSTLPSHFLSVLPLGQVFSNCRSQFHIGSLPILEEGGNRRVLNNYLDIVVSTHNFGTSVRFNISKGNAIPVQAVEAHRVVRLRGSHIF
jgi:hypothetical protein